MDSIVSDLVILELGTSFSDLRLCQVQDQEKLLENPEILAVRDLLQSSPYRGAIGDLTRGTKAKMKKHFDQADSHGGPATTKQPGIPAGVKLSKKISEGIICSRIPPILF